MGVASTGKTTLAKALNRKLGLPYIEGDDLHPKGNIERMSNGIPLNDADREPWLEIIRTTAEHMVAEQQGKSSSDNSSQRVGVMVTCSALKRYYRDILRGRCKAQGVPKHLESAMPARLATYFVYIKAQEALLRERIVDRQGHFMKPQMLDSQLATLESPEGEGGVVVVPLDKTTEEQVDIAIEELKRLLGELDFRTVEDRKDGEPEEIAVPEDVVHGK
ncbi:uncharacterized protein PHACADRAFT_258639 [Phanerochaete carnosa HHB-10118-sp]|uniref:Gluconokinase n=1 Tax=Phanerochaete carnosa (strain HHB-10118-sp) TaxID=650164 RepID=K5WW07_PHACS|nr:uncharacterized protein PHACADRAFT_258639 [Phanerochaete carnosa HHB-10118-sp]EKM54647.1 hypothetical protein PHACADRAFT_258639 [Phanerochaete carnosa HHB-10118-sp]